MVFPRSDGSRALARVVAVCAVNLVLLKSGVTAAAPEYARALSTDAPCGVSGGDKAVGINAIMDPSCSSGGLGCFNDHCRFCKTHTTPQSAHLQDCESYEPVLSPSPSPSSTPTPTPTPKPTPTQTPTQTPTPKPTPTTTPSTPAPPVGDCGVSDGDKAVGVFVKLDTSCASGGVGCYNDHCRHCKLFDTVHSSHLIGCDATAPPVTPPAPTPAQPFPSSDCMISEGDAAVGIRAAYDTKCIYGGLGCYSDHCRFCKFEETDKSAHLMACDLFSTPPPFVPPPVDGSEAPSGSSDGVPTPEPPSTGPGSDDGSAATPSASPTPPTLPEPASDDGSDATTPAPPVTTTEPEPMSDDGSSNNSPPEPTTNAPSSDAGSSDSTVEPTPVVDPFPPFPPFPSIPSDGSNGGDFNPNDGNTGTSCEFTASEIDLSNGIQLVGDGNCIFGGVGCYEQICRYCKYFETKASADLMDCSELGYDFEPLSGSQSSSADDDNIPTTEAPAPEPTTMLSSSSDTSSNGSGGPDLPGTGCPLLASEGDIAAGVSVVTDATCTYGGLGCLTELCRLCKFRNTPLSAHLDDCPDLETPTTTPAPTATNAPHGDSSALSSSEGSGSDDAPSTPMPTMLAPEPEAPTDDASSSSSSPSLSSSAASVGSDMGGDDSVLECPFTASEGDLSVGVRTITDLSCLDGGVGCYYDVCRYCRFFETKQSMHLEPCTPGGIDTPEPATSIDGSNTEEPNAPPASGSPAVGCTAFVSEGDASVGVSAVSDDSCQYGGLGCFSDSCRFCAAFVTDHSKHLGACESVPKPTTPAPTTPEPTTPEPTTPEPTTPEPTTPEPETTIPSETPEPEVTTRAPVSTDNCLASVSGGDKAVGISAVSDKTCVNGGLGCFSDSCRFCATTVTDHSKHLNACTTTPAPTTTEPEATTPTPETTTPAPEPETTTPAPEPETTTPAPEPETTTPAPTPTDVCSTYVSDGDKAAGVSAASDAACTFGGLGCFSDSCRFCKTRDTDASSHLLACSVVGSSKLRMKAASVKAASTVAATGNENTVDHWLQNKTVRAATIAAAGVGVAAVIALVAIGAKRVVNRLVTRDSTDLSDEEMTDVATADTESASAVIDAEEPVAVAVV